jgi:hypothetical protein
LAPSDEGKHGYISADCYSIFPVVQWSNGIGSGEYFSSIGDTDREEAGTANRTPALFSALYIYISSTHTATGASPAMLAMVNIWRGIAITYYVRARYSSHSDPTQRTNHKPPQSPQIFYSCPQHIPIPLLLDQRRKKDPTPENNGLDAFPFQTTKTNLKIDSTKAGNDINRNHSSYIILDGRPTPYIPQKPKNTK